jgi:hypothetical protein
MHREAHHTVSHTRMYSCIENSVHETEKNFGPFRSFQLQAESGGCVVLSGHLAAMMGPPGGPGGVVVGYPPRTPAQARVCTAPGDVPAPCPRGSRGYRSMVRVAIGSSAIHHFSLFHSRPWPLCTEYTLGPLLGSATSPPTNLWAIRPEWLRGARSDTNPTHIPPSVVAHRATTLTTFVAIFVRKIYLVRA